MSTYSNRLRVHKHEPLFWCPNCQPKPVIEKPWTVAGMATGAQAFATWEEAMAVATSYKVVVMN